MTAPSIPPRKYEVIQWRWFPHTDAMRLLKTYSIESDAGLELVSFDTGQMQPYAILSHTWSANDDDEVLYTDVIDGTAYTKPEFGKVFQMYARALADGYLYAWVDTCCIDKRSSAELSEAINSMFQWYRDSHVCYALLSDCSFIVQDDERNPLDPSFEESRWFSRGWTLQELIAPQTVVFFNAQWQVIGDKVGLSREVSRITGIDAEILTGALPIASASVANRMGWAARRVTRRPEDIAYCLLGIFSVNMPMLYGEGFNAFIRLQQEIMRESADHTIFAWIDDSAGPDEQRGVLATSPAMFSRTRHLVPYVIGEEQPYSLTNRGLSISLNTDLSTYVCFECPTPNFAENTFFAIHVRQLPNQRRRFYRVRAAEYLAYRLPNDAMFHSECKEIYLAPRPPVFSGGDELFPCDYIFLREVLAAGPYRVVDVIEYPSGMPSRLSYNQRTGPDTWRTTMGLNIRQEIKIRRGAMLVSAIVMFVSSDGERILVTLGTGATDVHSLAWDMMELPPTPRNELKAKPKKGIKYLVTDPDDTGETLAGFSKPDETLGEFPNLEFVERAFKPHPFGESIQMRKHAALVSMEIVRREKKKTWVLDFSLWPVDRRSPRLYRQSGS